MERRGLPVVIEIHLAHSEPGSVKEDMPGGEAALAAVTLACGAPAELRHTVGQNLQLAINFHKTAHI